MKIKIKELFDIDIFNFPYFKTDSNYLISKKNRTEKESLYIFITLNFYYN